MHANRQPFDDLGVFALMARALAPKPLGRRAHERGYSAASVRSAGVAEVLRGLLDRIDRWFWDQEERARDAYLGRATDLCDLEARIRDLERGVHTLHY